MNKPVVVFALALATGWALPSRADYLEVRRNALLKKKPARDASTVRALEPATLVKLTSEEQTDGYYRVATRSGEKGYLYRTLVRRHRGELPPAPPREPDDAEDESEAEGPSRPEPAPARSRRARTSSLSRLPELGASGTAEMRVHLINVGQGQSLLLEFSCGAALIDTGGETNEAFDSGNALRNYLDAFFTRRADLSNTIDLLAITHPHKDHILNAELVTEHYTVKNVITDGLTSSQGGPVQRRLHEWAESHAKLQKISVDDIPAGGLTSATIDPIRCADRDPKLKVLWGELTTRPAGWSEREFNNENNHSVVLRVDFGQSSLLIPGDLELQGIEALLAKHSPATLDADILQVGHHGSRNATTPDLLATITPLIALIPSGDPARELQWTAWDHGHPRQTVIDDLLEALETPRAAVNAPIATGEERFETVRLDEAIYATGWDGSVVVTASEEEKMSVVTER
jgi:competence protein ComEC